MSEGCLYDTQEITFLGSDFYEDVWTFRFMKRSDVTGEAQGLCFRHFFNFSWFAFGQYRERERPPQEFFGCQTAHMARQNGGASGFELGLLCFQEGQLYQEEGIKIREGGCGGVGVIYPSTAGLSLLV